jgi:hypothetical protein
MEFVFHYSFSPLVALFILGVVLVISAWKCSKKYNAFVAINILAVPLYLFGFSRVNSSLIPHYYNVIYICFYFLVAYILEFKSADIKTHFALPVKAVLRRNYIQKVVLSIVSFLLMGLYIYIQAPGYEFIYKKGSFQDASPRKIGAYIAEKEGAKKINLTTYPTDFTSRDCYQYFIELNGGSVVNGSSTEVTDTLYVLCDKQPCKVLKSDSWNIQMFGNAKIDTMKTIDGVTIYKLIHR